MLLLLLSFVALWAGPVLLLNTKPSRQSLVWIDRVIIAFVLLVVAFHVIPESIEQAGLIAIAAIALGALWPLVYQRVSHSENCYLQRSLLSLASVGLVTHMLLDGAAIANDSMLAMAVIFHRFPEGVGIWRIADAVLGRRWGVLILCVMMLTTAIGFFFGTAWLADASEGFVGLFEGLMAGVLLHVVFHKTHVQHMEEHG